MAENLNCEPPTHFPLIGDELRLMNIKSSRFPAVVRFLLPLSWGFSPGDVKAIRKLAEEADGVNGDRYPVHYMSHGNCIALLQVKRQVNWPPLHRIANTRLCLSSMERNSSGRTLNNYPPAQHTSHCKHTPRAYRIPEPTFISLRDPYLTNLIFSNVVISG